MARLTVSLRIGPHDLMGAARSLRELADKIDRIPEYFRAEAVPVVSPLDNGGMVRITGDYHKGQTRILTQPQTDDDDGAERITPAGSTVEIVDVIHNSPNPYAVACPANGATWFFTAAELDQQTTGDTAPDYPTKQLAQRAESDPRTAALCAGILDGLQQGDAFDSGLTFDDPILNESYDTGVNAGQTVARLS